MVKDSFGREYSLEAMKLAVGPGWGKLIEEVYAILAAHDEAVVLQIKEKFGMLRVYTCNIPDDVETQLTAIENKSAEVCDVCGEPGAVISRDGWYMARCSACREK